MYLYPSTSIICQDWSWTQSRPRKCGSTWSWPGGNLPHHLAKSICTILIMLNLTTFYQLKPFAGRLPLSCIPVRSKSFTWRLKLWIYTFPPHELSIFVAIPRLLKKAKDGKGLASLFSMINDHLLNTKPCGKHENKTQKGYFHQKLNGTLPMDS